MPRNLLSALLLSLGVAFTTSSMADRDRHHGDRWPERGHYHDKHQEPRHHGRHHKHKLYRRAPYVMHRYLHSVPLIRIGKFPVITVRVD